MSRIFGFFWKVPRETDSNQQILRRMASANQDSEAWNADYYCDEQTGIGQLKRKNGDLNSSFLLHEEILLIENGFPYFPNQKSIGGIKPSLLDIYKKKGSSLIVDVSGTFNLLIYDRDKKINYIFSDRYGYKHIFYYSDDKVTIYATEIKFIIASGLVNSQVNRSAIYDMFNFRFIIGNKTFLNSINLLPHGTFLQIDDLETKLVKYWDYPQEPFEASGEPHYLIDKGRCLLEKALSRHSEVGINPVIALSGGFDSRTILGLLSKTRNDVECFHLGYPGWGETKIASKLCQETKSKLCIHDPLDIKYKDFLEEALYLTDGHLSIEQMDFFPFVKNMGSRPGAFMLDGFALDQCFHFYHFVSASKEKFGLDSLLKILINYYNPLPEGLLNLIFSDETARSIKKSVKENMVEWIEQFDSKSYFEITQRFYCTNRGRRYTAATTILNGFNIDYFLPGLDKNLFDFCLKLPAKDRINGTTYKNIIEKSMPELAKFPHGKTGLMLKEKPGSLYKTKKKLLQKLYYVGRLTHGHIDFLPNRDRNKKFRRDREFRDFLLATLLDKRTESRGLYRKGGIEKLVELQMSGRNYAGLFLTAVQVESFFRNFVD